MNTIINRMRKNSGYISIETVIIAGLIIGIGTSSIAGFQSSSNEQVQRSVDVIYTELGGMEIFKS